VMASSTPSRTPKKLVEEILRKGTRRVGT
jgi:hypothetical protein